MNINRNQLIGGGVLAAMVLVIALVVTGGGGDDEASDQTPPTTSPAPTETAATSVPDDPVTDPGDFASQLQQDLTELGYYDGEITGQFDEATEQALRAFQEFAGIEADGVYGPETAAALDVALGRPGASSGLQTALAGLCYYSGPIDGDYGPATTDAVLQFQLDSGLPADGFYGPETAAALVVAWPSRPEECPVEPEEDVPEDVKPEDEALSAITASVNGTGVTFNNDVSCVLGPDDSGSIEGTADDGTTLLITIDGTASSVVIDGPLGSFDAPFTSISNDETVMTITAEPPPIEILVGLAACTES